MPHTRTWGQVRGLYEEQAPSNRPSPYVRFLIVCVAKMLAMSLFVRPKEEIPEYLAELVPESFCFGAVYVPDVAVVDAIGLTATMLPIRPLRLIWLCAKAVAVGVESGVVRVLT